MAKTIWKMDRKTAQYIIEHTKQNHFDFELCPKCGADFIKELGHDCDNTIKLEAHLLEENDNVEPFEK